MGDRLGSEGGGGGLLLSIRSVDDGRAAGRLEVEIEVPGANDAVSSTRVPVMELLLVMLSGSCKGKEQKSRRLNCEGRRLQNSIVRIDRKAVDT